MSEEITKEEQEWTYQLQRAARQLTFIRLGKDKPIKFKCEFGEGLWVELKSDKENI